MDLMPEVQLLGPNWSIAGQILLTILLSHLVGENVAAHLTGVLWKSACAELRDSFLGLLSSAFFFLIGRSGHPSVCLTICLRVRPGRHKPERGRAGRRGLVLRTDLWEDSSQFPDWPWAPDFGAQQPCGGQQITPCSGFGLLLLLTIYSLPPYNLVVSSMTPWGSDLSAHSELPPIPTSLKGTTTAQRGDRALRAGCGLSLCL